MMSASNQPPRLTFWSKVLLRIPLRHAYMRMSVPAPLSVHATMSVFKRTCCSSTISRLTLAVLSALIALDEAAGRECTLHSCFILLRSPSRRTCGFHGLPLAPIKPSRVSRSTISSSEQLLAVHTSTRTLRGGLSVAFPAEGSCLPPRIGLANIMTGSCNLSFNAAMMAITVFVLPVPGGPCNNRMPSPNSAHFQMASHCDKLYCCSIASLNAVGHFDSPQRG
mmetsp:Transcript_34524/g.57140  ORF Transcript_34524/g.57140 Transcript_34524/m.57140 type:complete len:223 (+) Transcript_34524:1140-1808(+)